MKKIALFVFNGDPMCFIHVLLNALDMKAKGYQAAVVVEGAATGLLPALAQTDNPLHGLWEKTRAAGLVAGACKACAGKMGTLDVVKTEGLELLDDMHGHPSMSGYIQDGFDVISF
ncbi:MAG: cytoplasmic protein [Deltaproteobacteria bacterium]|nr:cytoplasmic protein [Deltaproteobacteria bacterium]